MSNHNKETEARCLHCYRHYVEGTAAWALYMMRMGHKITNPMYDPRVYHLPEGSMIHANGIKSIATSQWIDYWCIDIPDGWEIYAELDPSKVIVKIGCLKGTIERHDGSPQYWFKLRSSEYHYALISIEMLDTPTRELVESLLKAQEEK